MYIFFSFSINPFCFSLYTTIQQTKILQNLYYTNTHTHSTHTDRNIFVIFFKGIVCILVVLLSVCCRSLPHCRSTLGKKYVRFFLLLLLLLYMCIYIHFCFCYNCCCCLSTECGAPL